MSKDICVIPADVAIFNDRKAMAEIHKAAQERGGYVLEYSDIGQYLICLPDNTGDKE